MSSALRLSRPVESLTAIATGKVVGCVYEDRGVSCAKRYPCQDGPYPMHRRHAGPRKPQFSDRGQTSTDTNHADHGFRRYLARLGVLLVRIDHPSKQGLATYDYEAPYGQPGKCKSGYTHGPAPDAGEDYGVGNEAKIENAVDDCYVRVPKHAKERSVSVFHMGGFKEKSDQIGSVKTITNGRLRLTFRSGQNLILLS